MLVIDTEGPTILARIVMTQALKSDEPTPPEPRRKRAKAYVIVG